jgi:hypothetical protein
MATTTRMTPEVKARFEALTNEFAEVSAEGKTLEEREDATDKIKAELELMGYGEEVAKADAIFEEMRKQLGGKGAGKTASLKKIEELFENLGTLQKKVIIPSNDTYIHMASTPAAGPSGIQAILDDPESLSHTKEPFSGRAVPVKRAPKVYTRQPDESEREFHERVEHSYPEQGLFISCNALDNFTNTKTQYMRAAAALHEAKAMAVELAKEKGKKEQKKDLAARVKKMTENLATRFDVLYKAVGTFVQTFEDAKKEAASSKEEPHDTMPDQIGHVMFFLMNARACYDAIPEEKADERALVKYLYNALKRALPGVRAPYDKAKPTSWGKTLLAPPPYISDSIRTLIRIEPDKLIVDDFVSALHEVQRIRLLAAEVWYCHNVMRHFPTCVTADMRTKLEELSARHAAVFGPLISPLESDDPAPISREAFAKTVEESTFYVLCSDILGRAVTSASTKLQEEMKDMTKRHVEEYNVEVQKLRAIQLKYMERNPLPELAGARVDYEQAKTLLAGDNSQEAKKKIEETEERVKALTNYANYWKNPHPMVESELKEVETQFNKTLDVREAANVEANKYRHEHDQTVKFIEEYCKELVANYN